MNADPQRETELLELFSQLSSEQQERLLGLARTIAAEPTPEERQARWQEFLNRPRAAEFDDEFEIAIEECRYMPVPFWHPHESVY